MKNDLEAKNIFDCINIIDETDDYLVIDKPAGLIVHGGNPSITSPTLADWLIAKYPEISSVGEDPSRPGIVHRLDREVSGLMVVAKNQKMFLHLKKQFKSRKTKKGYVAIVYGKLTPEYGTIDFPIARAKAGHKMAALPKMNEEKNKPNDRDRGNIRALDKSREAITGFTVRQSNGNLSLVDVDLHTGRTHQIRVHMSAMGHPLVGDNLYANKKSAAQNQKKQFGRIMLSSTNLSFTDQNKEIRSYHIEPPKTFSVFFPELNKFL
jgi:23S rRNA pseudouridine1911/1915/1917 synthase